MSDDLVDREARRTTYRALIVEDDPQAAAALRSYLERYGEERGVRFVVETLGSALELLDERRTTDIVFLDIGLPGINGMEAAEIVRQTDEVTPIVFVTDLAQYAVHGYRVDALDFMVKPVSYGDFALRMGRALRVMARNADDALSIPAASGTRIVKKRDILYVEILRHDLYWHLADGSEPLRMRGSLTAAAERLGAERFCRVSASHLINMGQVTAVRGAGVTLSDGTELAFSRTRKKEALEALARFAGGSI